MTYTIDHKKFEYVGSDSDDIDFNLELIFEDQTSVHMTGTIYFKQYKRKGKVFPEEKYEAPLGFIDMMFFNEEGQEEEQQRTLHSRLVACEYLKEVFFNEYGKKLTITI